MTVLEDADCEGVAEGTTGASSDDDGMTTGEQSSTGETTDAGETETGTESGSSTTGPMPCLEPEDCTDASEPYCGQGGTCIACSEAPSPEEGDEACASANAATPACNDDGTCVTCTPSNVTACEGVTPLCDTDAETCIGCTQHDQCPDSACHIPSLIGGADDPDDGACFAIEFVMHIDGDDEGDFTTIEDAVNAVGDDAEAVFIVHAGASVYNEGIAIDGGKTIAFLAAADETPSWQQTTDAPDTNPNLRITDSATVFLHRMFINTNADPGGPAIEVDGARLHAQRSRIINNSGGGLGATGSATVELENCYVGDATTDISAVVVDSGEVRIAYSTLGTGFGSSETILCSGGTVTVNDSILATRGSGPITECPGLSLTTTASELNVTTTWFDNFNNGGFDLTETGETQFGNIAEWNDGDPPTDIDGTLRPTDDGTQDYAGAYRP